MPKTSSPGNTRTAPKSAAHPEDVSSKFRGGVAPSSDRRVRIVKEANGIGEAVAKYLVANGAKVAIIDMQQDRINRVLAEIRETGGVAIGIQADVTSEADTARFVAETVNTFGHLNIAVTCAGIIRDGTMLTLDRETGTVTKKLGLDKWKPVIDVNLTGSFLTLRDAAEAINKVGQLGQLNYASAKVAIDLWPKVMVGEFLLRGIRNIRVVGIAPGYTETGLLAQMNQEALKAILQDVHLGRLVRPEEIADMIGYCVKNAALNATTIEITGGLCYPKGIAK